MGRRFAIPLRDSPTTHQNAGNPEGLGGSRHFIFRMTRSAKRLAKFSRGTSPGSICGFWEIPFRRKPLMVENFTKGINRITPARGRDLRSRGV